MKLITLALLVRIVHSWPPTSPEVTIHNGTLQGIHIPTFNQDAYLGIPYAQPPLHSLRFAPPQPYNESWDGVFPADEYGPACISTGGTDTIHLEHSEDCLTVNVVKPAGECSELPVAVWIHGGSFTDGSGSRPQYNLSYIVQNGVEIGKPFVGVSINYRLGGFGFLGSSAVSTKGWTNIGIRDQIKAVEWVRENIEAFGGDPEHIVLWGESAGAISVGKLLTSGKVDFVKGAIMESGSAIVRSMQGVNSEGFEKDFAALVEYGNCTEAVDPVVCLQEVDADELQYAFNSTNGIMTNSRTYVYMDGDIVKKSGFDSYAEGSFAHVPVLIGSNTDEGTGFTSTTITDEDSVVSFLQSTYPYLTNSSISELMELYNANDTSLHTPLQPDWNTPESTKNVTDWFRSISTFIGDLYYIAPARWVAEHHSNAGLKTFKYRHNIPSEDMYAASGFYGTTHYEEVAYVFYTGQKDQDYADANDGHKWLADDRSEGISKNMSQLWAAFITDLDPDTADNGVEWPDYQSETAQNLVFDINGIYIEDDTFRTEQYEFLAQIHHQLRL